MPPKPSTPKPEKSREVPPHWLRRNRSTYTPRRVIAFDCESDQVPSALGRLHTFKLACATFDRRRDRNHNRKPDDAITVTGDPKRLWEWVESKTDRNESTYAYAHHLDFDVMVAQAMPNLVNLGWELMGMSTVR